MPSAAMEAVIAACRSQKPLLSSAYDPVAFRAQLTFDPDLARPRRPLGSAGASVESRGQGGSCLLAAVAGGGFCFPPSDQHRLFLDRLGSALDASVHLLHPRLAPESAFPAAYEDVGSGLADAFEAAGSTPLLAIADSSGAALLLAAVMQRRDAGSALPAAIVLISALTDCAMTGLSNVVNSALDPMFGPEAIIHKTHHYLQGHNPTDWRASPLWGRLDGLPSMLLIAGSTEVMLDDSRRLAEKIRQAGGKADLIVEDEAPHDYPLISDIPESVGAFNAILGFLSQHRATAPARHS